MRRLFLLVLMLCCLAVSAVASAAQVTDVKWGVDKDNMLRFVVDLTDAAPYKIEVNDKLIKISDHKLFETRGEIDANIYYSKNL